jgi:hypothetical protein
MWIEDVTNHLPLARNQHRRLNLGGLWRDQRYDETTHEVICRPKPYGLLDALPELWELSLRYRFNITIGDQIKPGYSVGFDYRAKLAALLSSYDLIQVAEDTCELRLTPSPDTFPIIQSEAKAAIRYYYPEMSAAEVDRRVEEFA